MTKLRIMSDLHAEFHKDWLRSWARGLSAENTDVLVLAGDIIPLSYVDNARNLFDILCEKFQDIVWVLGNHCPWGSSFSSAYKEAEDLATNYTNLHFLLYTHVRY